MKIKALILAVMMMTGFAGYAHAEVKAGDKAPAFTATDTNGNEHSLSDFEGKTVVLEWSNHDCPFVVKHYEPGNMQALQKEATDNDVVWITVVSSADGKQGNVTAEEANKIMEEKGANSTARILDPSGEIGKLYGEGMIVYDGAIDSDSSFKQSSIDGATNYVREALNSIAAGEEIKVASTKPYGCSVKY